ncbi:hypothetical protein CEP54_006030 [Fusarium duplospermum]|uniref:Uncharacterized protein n=1 Tax=Fusarium duplospermum TaxID=1325734 RepID=A0A428Q9K2_9HYPO|nr:hypothetical protein CEP54_006030 [Fusarium duplospermum]
MGVICRGRYLGQKLFKENEQETKGEPTEPSSKKRKREDERKKKSPKKSRQERKDARRYSAKAFLSIIMNEKSEKQQTSDLTTLWSASESRTDPKAVVRTPESQELFFEEVFQDWQSDQDALAPGVKISAKKRRNGTGQLESEREPEPTANKKRKRTDEADSQPPAQRRCRKNVRRCSDKAYLGAIWNKTLGEPRWTWKDSSGQAANGESVNLRHGLDIYAWKDRCLNNYDIHERRLTRIYNRDLVVASSRMRIIKWAEEGAAPNRTPSIYAESCPKLREPDLMAPKVRAYYATTVERMDKSNKAVPTMPTSQNQ